MMRRLIDISEDWLLSLGHDILATLLTDQSMSQGGERHNIFWATSDYESLGDGFCYKDEINIANITGEHAHVVMPRVLKNKQQQTARSKDMAEVFTPSWVCNAQNNLIDNAWFGRENVFNTETQADGVHSWQPTAAPITFPEGKTWQDYVADTRLEITCGEAPYLVSRYDTTTGQFIPLFHRIGLLDRKMRILGENTTTLEEWIDGMLVALKSTYGYEWQGDNLLLARESVFLSVIDYYQEKFHALPAQSLMLEIADIISWNLWQMDGLKCVVPGTCHSNRIVTYDMFSGETEEVTPCMGCTKNDIKKHNGVYCIIRDWTLPEGKQTLTYVSMIKQ